MLVPPALRRRLTGGRNGAPPGNQNAFKHGKFTRERRAFFAKIREHIRDGQALIEGFNAWR